MVQFVLVSEFWCGQKILWEEMDMFVLQIRVARCRWSIFLLFLLWRAVSWLCWRLLKPIHQIDLNDTFCKLLNHWHFSFLIKDDSLNISLCCFVSNLLELGTRLPECDYHIVVHPISDLDTWPLFDSKFEIHICFCSNDPFSSFFNLKVLDVSTLLRRHFFSMMVIVAHPVHGTLKLIWDFIKLLNLYLAVLLRNEISPSCYVFEKSEADVQAHVWSQLGNEFLRNSASGAKGPSKWLLTCLKQSSNIFILNVYDLLF